ncbi:MAG: hypothetical protein JWM74_1585 [Myxococcaceae bacterium]|nr:hypothetical protein [Myxococcaceae bacterium]
MPPTARAPSWRLGILIPVGLAIACASVACSALFDDAVQCTTDADCAGFASTVCGAEGTCVASSGPDGSTPGTTEDGAIATGDAAPGDDGGPAIVCLPDASRLLVAIPGKPFNAGDAGGAGTEITSDTRLSCDKDWSLTGTVVVRAGATLRIDRSVIVRADVNAALVVQPGGRLLVEGTATEPVVVTSAKSIGVPGDFRGVYVLGRAAAAGNLVPPDPIFAFGAATTAPDDSSGSLKFLRIEYATQGLHLAGVGRGTVVDSVQVRRTSDDAITITGGTVNAKHVVVQLAGDEAFVLRGGYQGKLQYVISQRVAAGIGRNGLLVEGARPTIYNATFCGTPAATPNVANGLLVRANGRPDLHNTVVSGYAAGYDQQGDASDTQVASCVFFGQLVENLAYPEDAAEVDDASPYFDDDNGFDEAAFLTQAARGNSVNDPQIARCFNADNPGFAPATKLVAPAPPADGFFETAATFRGAVKDATADWTKAPWLVWSSK